MKSWRTPVHPNHITDLLGVKLHSNSWGLVAEEKITVVEWRQKNIDINSEFEIWEICDIYPVLVSNGWDSNICKGVKQLHRQYNNGLHVLSKTEYISLEYS